jgi:hypothetical protein
LGNLKDVQLSPIDRSNTVRGKRFMVHANITTYSEIDVGRSKSKTNPCKTKLKTKELVYGSSGRALAQQEALSSVPSTIQNKQTHHKW